ncbi:chordin-like protein 2 isoform X2 [Triplophysa dalaica]|uniref:chordin-like protein 2 isoform X2 n=1 Tax=Triplophysa dalaica TaxID=1582913 RepID=UPI0024DF5E12|nr:chordin-like protein 2 isoform X2 [Triplophysa dalaica]
MKKRMIYLEHLFVLVIMRWFVLGETEAMRPGKMSGVFCTFKEKLYRQGDSWHPYLEPFGFIFCMRCTCTEMSTGLLLVSGHRLKPVGIMELCTRPGKHLQIMSSSHPASPTNVSCALALCVCNERQYEKADINNGNIFCGLKTCQPITCLSPVSVPDTCCLVCKEGAIHLNSASFGEGGQQLNRGVRHSVDHCAAEKVRGRSVRATPSTLRGLNSRSLNLPTLHIKGGSETTVKILLQRKHHRACVYSGKTYSHGDVWHPVLGRVLDCILCTCRDSFQECKRITCPTQYPCQHPIKIEGKCCKICPELKAEGNRTDCFLGQDKNSLLVYKVMSSSASQSEDKVRRIAIERHGATEVEVQVWKTVEGVLHLVETGDVQKKDLIEHPENYILLTTLDEDTWRKFKEEEEKQKDFSKTQSCEDGIKEVVKYLNPEQLDRLCAS